MRKFLVNPKYRFFIGSENQELLLKLNNGISSPKHIPYLGISDCLAYIRDISKIKTAKPILLKDTESIVSFEEGQLDLEFHIKIKKSGDFTIYTEMVTAPTSFDITEKGRKPITHKKFLMSVNCRLFFRKAIEGYEIDGENVCLM